MAVSNNPELRHCRLLIAGGWDDRLKDNVDTFQQLHDAASSLGLTTSDSLPSTAQVIFLRNISDDEKLALLRSNNILALLYTPAEEHFGIVPLEAMACGLPVLACNSGGPRETIQDQVTGYLLPEDDPSAWAARMMSVVPKRREMGAAGKSVASAQFSLQEMSAKLENILAPMLDLPRPREDDEAMNALIKVGAVVGSILALLGLTAIVFLTDNK